MRRFLLLPLLAACTGETTEPDPCEPGPDPSFEIGTGELRYVPLSEVEQQLELIHGPQGGYHVLIGIQASGIDASDELAVDLSGTIGGEPIAAGAPWADLRCNTQVGALQGWGYFLIYDAEPEDLDGQDTHITATLTDVAGTVLTAEADAVIFDPNL